MNQIPSQRPSADNGADGRPPKPSAGQSIKEFDRPADRIRQHRQADLRPVLVVEGPSDARLIGEAFDKNYAIFPVNGRRNAIETTRQLASWNTKRMACVVDRDFDETVAISEREGLPIHAYENADLEAMLCGTDALRRLVAEIGSVTKLAQVGGYRGLLAQLHEAVAPVTRLRVANARYSWGLAFDKVDLASKIDIRTLRLNVQGYCDALRATADSGPSKSKMLEVANGLDLTLPLPVCPKGATPYFRGRDLLASTGVALRQRAGSCVKAVTDAEHLAAVLRLTAVAMLPTITWGKDLETKAAA